MMISGQSMEDLREKSGQQIPKVDDPDLTLRLRVTLVVCKYGVYLIDFTIIQYNRTSILGSQQSVLENNSRNVAYSYNSAEIEMVIKQAYSGVSLRASISVK